MTNYFSSDLHIGHQSIINFENRPFVDVPSMNEAIVEQWNEVVKADDTAWILGDVALGRLDDSLAFIHRLNGYKILVPGNHDRCFPGARDMRRGEGDIREARRAKLRQKYFDAGFAEITDAIVATTVGGHKVVMSHFPYEGDSHGADRYTEWRPVDRGRWIIHGHVHGRWRQRGRQINVGFDVWNGRPVSEDQIVDLMESGPRDLVRLPWS